MVRYAHQAPPLPPPFVTRLWSQCSSIVSQMEGSAAPPTGCLHTLLSPASTRCHLPLAYSTSYVIVYSIVFSILCSIAYSIMYYIVYPIAFIVAYCIAYSIAIDTTAHHSFSSKNCHLCHGNSSISTSCYICIYCIYTIYILVFTSTIMYTRCYNLHIGTHYCPPPCCPVFAVGEFEVRS